MQGSPSDIDYLTIAVPAGDVLSQIVLESFSSTDQKGFIGVESGTTFHRIADGSQLRPSARLHRHFGTGAGNVGADILPEMGTGAGAQGFTAPPGGRGRTRSGFSSWARPRITISTLPLRECLRPSSFALGVVGIAALGFVSRRKRAFMTAILARASRFPVGARFVCRANAVFDS